MRLARLLTMMILGALVGVHVPAAAQIASSRSGQSGVDFISDEEALREVVAFGRCYARMNPTRSYELLGTVPSSREELIVYRRLFSGGQACMEPGTTIGASLPLVRGAIAESLFKASAPVPRSHLQTPPALSAVRNLSDAARCYAGQRPDEVRALAATRPGSREEAARITAIWPQFSQCLPAGTTVRFSAIVIRYRLVEALLRLAPTTAVAPRGTN